MTPGRDDLVVTRWSARFHGRNMPCATGRGIGTKMHEGDGLTPVGIFRIMGLLIRPDRLSLRTPHIAQRLIGPGLIWSDDPADPAYNTPLNAPNHPFSHERLRRPDGLYDIVAVLDYNLPDPTPGAGSAIFLHSWRKPRHPTEGCVAFDPAALLGILSRWSPRSRVVIRA